MDESSPGPAPSSRAPIIALALAGGALVLAAVAVVVVLVRGGGGSGAKEAETPAPRITTLGRELFEGRTTAEALVAATWGDGIRDVDERVVLEPASAFGLEPTDELLSIAGRPATRATGARLALRSVLRMDIDAVLFEVKRAGKPVVVRVEVDGDLREALAAQRAASAAASGGLGVGASGGTASAADLDLSGIVRTDDTHVQIPRALVDSVLANPMTVAKGARVVPSVKQGVANGFKLYAVRPGSIYAELGFANGDTITAVNGMVLDSMDDALEAYTKLRAATRVEVAIERRGKPIELTITVK